MPQPSIPRWMSTRSRNTVAHPGVVDISVEEVGDDHVPKTPLPRKKTPRPRQTKNLKSAEEVEAGIQRVAAYEKRSLDDELINATPHGIFTLATPRRPSEHGDSSEHDGGGDINDNMSYKPHSETTPDTLITDAGVGSLPSPVVNVSPGRKTIEGKKAAVRFSEETQTESEDEPTPFKKVMAEKRGKPVEDTACGSVEEPTQFDGLVYDRAESDDEPTQFQRVVSEREEPTQFQGVGPVGKKGEGKTLVHLGSDVKRVQPVAASGRPKPRPLKWAEPPAPALTHVKAASKAASELNATDESDANDEPPQFKLPKPKPSQPKTNPSQPKTNPSQPKTNPSQPKTKPSQPKSEVAKAREALKKSQEAMRKAQEEQKRAREMAKKMKESVRQPGIRDRIKAVNNEANADSEGPHLSRMSRAGKSSTHRGKDTAIAKPNQNSTIKGHRNPSMSHIYDFGTDEEEFDHDNDDAEPAEEAHAVEIGKKVAVSNKGLGESGKGNGRLINEREKKGKAKKVEMGAEQEQKVKKRPTVEAPKQRSSSNNDQDHPPSKKRRGTRDYIYTWIDDTLDAPPPPSRANSKTSFNPPPSLTVGSTWSSSNSALTNGIRITQNTRLPTGTKKANIKVEEKGIYSDYDETTGQERDKAVSSPLKNGARATSSNIVTENKSKYIAPPKVSKNFKKSDLPDGLNYDVLRRTIVPTVITYYARQKDPWDRQPSLLCDEIYTIMKSAGGMDFEVDPKGPIYKNVTQRLSDSWRAVLGSASLALITTYIFENQQSEFSNQAKVTAWAQNQLTNYRFLYQKAEGEDMKEWRGLFRSGSVVGTFAAHLVAAQGARRVPELEVGSAKPPYDHSYGALALSAAGVQHALLLYATDTITLQMIYTTGKPPSPLPKAFNRSTGEFSTRSTGFNDSAWGDQTRGFIKLISKNLRPESYNKIVAGAHDIAKKTRGAIGAKEIIDLTADEPPDEFAMLVDIPSDDDEDSKIGIIESGRVGRDVIIKQVVNAGEGESGNEYECEDGEVSDNDDESLQLDYTSE